MKPVFIIVGGGAAGFFCAVNAARMYPGLQVVVLEKSSKLLSKVKVSGGGRCNVTHHCNGLADLLQHYPRGASFLKRSFHHFATNDTVSWFRERGVELKTEEDGRMFPVSNSSETIIRCLLDEAARYGVDIRICEVAAIAVLNTDGLYSLTAVFHSFVRRQAGAGASCMRYSGWVSETVAVPLAGGTGSCHRAPCAIVVYFQYAG
ncbi:MAG: NAD(P)/FAD-dependent oxidoreductase [Ferruginibacter sp.]